MTRATEREKQPHEKTHQHQRGQTHKRQTPTALYTAYTQQKPAKIRSTEKREASELVVIFALERERRAEGKRGNYGQYRESKRGRLFEL